MNFTVFAMLQGRWVFARDIRPDDVSVRGEAAFLPDGLAALAYSEAGTLLLANGQSFTAVRRYRYRVDAQGLHVDFADGPDAGRPFVSLDFRPSEGGEWAEASASHPCRADTYNVHIRVKPGDLVIEIAATGPAKSYVATTRLTRALSAD